MTEISQQPDIEIYVRNASHQNILDWLNQTFDKVELKQLTYDSFSKGRSVEGQVTFRDTIIPVFIMPHAAGKAFTSIWFKSDKTKWPNDEACALDFLTSVDTEVRCSANSWHENEDENSDQWWLIKRNEKRLIRWG